MTLTTTVERGSNVQGTESQSANVLNQPGSQKTPTLSRSAVKTRQDSWEGKYHTSKAGHPAIEHRGCEYTQRQRLSIPPAFRVTAILFEAVQGELEGLDEIHRVLDATRHAHKPVGDTNLEAILFQHVGVRHD